MGNPLWHGASGAKGAGQGGCRGFQRDLLAVLRDDLDLPGSYGAGQAPPALCRVCFLPPAQGVCYGRGVGMEWDCTAEER